ncbi:MULTISPECIES: nucleotide sugar dehydrogenase [Brevibacillus]|jgi:UDP-N-acetyl-D-galactosamine dehydrogenase|uniref:UDP-N-acetyl-D-galactosamine dehydrogenase n=1 Tax=Brevibacillus parabrevis TaxID=54914 RepID=A0A4Y3PLM2_BREPA|nr:MULTISPECIES: nucleotide sugar dehydrogenase [Brevibacillus]MDR4998700.1 nucleotide sugar dehydrogenase [Brevibacillus parabrevis]MED2254833.1 nucleotide sugar dehydrogenase [Brevibacillus parabrevis]NRQ54392.1 nucleotide sugar dehydrogenase [Brevibacillus sp. HD1.4A]RNB95638.1 nucleotide sugar dehydrogenase [Brevibacillus parabrevis]WDV93921.1 nucleotide sugar dehydrogenase [Brevibacillus parabrevis]
MDLFDAIVERQEKIAVVGLGYVGLPVAVALAEKVSVIGFDVNRAKVDNYQNGLCPDGSMDEERLRASTIDFTSDETRLSEARFFIVAVPTPIKSGNVPDLHYVQAATRTVAKHMPKGSVVVFESTVYPGVTEEICIPILESESNMRCGEDFTVGYSPERINPGDDVHRFESIVKIVSGMDEQTLDTVARVYGLVVEAGVYRAESIKVAEAAKVIENAQRDINIAFMNELAMLFHQMGIDTKAVLQAARTKWNFLPFTPGLVGGHCIGIDPYYLTYKAEDSGYHSKIILAGRHINDGMGKYIAEQIIKSVVRMKLDVKNVKIGIMGLAYKENCPDIRNSKVVDIVSELHEYGIVPLVVDPLADPRLAYEEYRIELSHPDALKELDVVIVAVPHAFFASMSVDDFDAMYGSGQTKMIFDIKGVYQKADFVNKGYHYWSL